jgi:Domain of unknown function (DUF4365)
MSVSKSRSEYVARRGALLAELFLEDLEPEFVARTTDDVGYDFLVGFRNSRGGVNNTPVEVKTTEHLVHNRFPLGSVLYKRFAYSNTPVLLIVVDVKNNRFYYAWLSSHDAVTTPASDTVMIPLTEIDERTKEGLRKELAT